MKKELLLLNLFLIFDINLQAKPGENNKKIYIYNFLSFVTGAFLSLSVYKLIFEDKKYDSDLDVEKYKEQLSNQIQNSLSKASLNTKTNQILIESDEELLDELLQDKNIESSVKEKLEDVKKMLHGKNEVFGLIFTDLQHRRKKVTRPLASEIFEKKENA